VFIMFLLSGKCSSRTPNKNCGFLFFLFDPKFLKMAPGSHNAATNQINRSHCVDRTRWWGNAGGIHMRKISYISGVVAVLVLVGVGTWIGVEKGLPPARLLVPPSTQ
jgi:hypothetical protein